MNEIVVRLIGELRSDLTEISPDAEGVLSQIEENLRKGQPSLRLELFHPTNGQKPQEVIGETLFLNRMGNVSIFKAAKAIYDRGENAAVLFNSIFTLLAAMESDGCNYTPTVNIAPCSACSRKFWDLVDPVLDRAGRKNFIFEIVEYGPGMQPDREALKIYHKAVEKGCRFALDDISSAEDVRLKYFGKGVGHIKIDGHVYSRMRDQFNVPEKLAEYRQMILRQFREAAGEGTPDPEFVIEFVNSVEEFPYAARSAELAQGCNLPKSNLCPAI